jgi:hypothetical protein
VVIDNGSNRQKAVKIEKLTSLSCFAHYLQLAILDGIKTTNLDQHISDIHDLLTSINKNSSITCSIMQQQAKLNSNKKTHKIILNCPTH